MVSEWGKLQFCWEGIKCCDSVDSVLFLAPSLTLDSRFPLFPRSPVPSLLLLKMLHSAELRPPKEDTCGGERAASPPGGHPPAELLFSTFPDFFICDFYICAHIKPVCHVAENEKRTR